MTILCKDRLLDLSRPVVMGILNLTPDSFFDGGRYHDAGSILRQTEKMLRDGATILDLGGASSRSGAQEVSEHEELSRVMPALEEILRHFPEAILSVDTWRAGVARQAIAAGAHIVNDISGGRLDNELFKTVGDIQAPYVLMHMQGTPQTMQQNPQYEDVVTEVLDYFIQQTALLRATGVKDIILDPGFGFGKTVEHNYTLLKNLKVFETVLGLPVLAGLSRKSMIYKPLGVKPEQALNGTTALHMVALQQGARILRVHDVREAWEVIQLWQQLQH
ncbi:MAG: dihydropteroate synthase [Saprospiraceae bacterium]|nr:dihydropteroate synthase [Saprospiraceae bacterium]